MIDCGNCGARNAEGSQWCSQCFRALETTGRVTRRLPDHEWRCGNCGAQNQMTAIVCVACGTSLEEALSADEHQIYDPTAAGRLGLIVPGGGLMKVGKVGLGALTMVTVLFGVVVGAILATSGRAGLGVPMLLIGLGVHLVAARDGVSYAEEAEERVLLKPRLLTGAFGLLFVLLLLAALSTPLPERGP